MENLTIYLAETSKMEEVKENLIIGKDLTTNQNYK